MSQRFDAIVIGGGIMGCSCALELARRGVKTVLVEKGTIGEGPTGHSSAIVRQHYSNELTARMALYSLRVFQSFDDAVGGECGFHRTGFVVLVGEGDTAGLEANIAMQRRLGISTSMLTPVELREIMPGIETADLVAAAYEPESGYADPYLTVNAFAQAARRAGVVIELDTEVTGVRLEGDRVVGVETPKGRLDAPRVLNTAGAWGARVARLAGVELPIDACRVQVGFFRRPPGHEAAHPVVADFVHASYFRPDTAGLTLAGLIDPSEADAIVDPDDFARSADFRFLADAGERLSRRYPAMAHSEQSGGYASLYAITPDWHPIVDEVPAGSGFFVCSGFSGHGFKLGPAVGVMVADLVTGESASEFDSSLFRLDRYALGREVRGEYEYSIVG